MTPDQSAAAAATVVATMQAHAPGVDAAITAAFSDPGLHEARATLPFPVIGIAEAAMTEAARFAERFTLVACYNALESIYRRHATDLGVAPALANMRLLYPLLDRTDDLDAIREVLLGECRRAVVEDGAGAIVIGGGPLSGLAEALSMQFTIPLLDGVPCAVRLAERLVRGQ